ncbi:MAG TPA: hypothetical protein PLP05_10300, partial [Sedimentisphaerales bacterium]|nr:hypothetical protein [Sedimentisphaerales bacterium]
MAFNPDAFIAKNKSFNPDAFIAKNKPQPKVETIPTKQEAMTLPPPQRSVMSAVTNPVIQSKVQNQEPETELTDFKAIEDKITTNGYEDLTPDEQITYLENRPQLPNVQPDYPDEVNNSAKSTAQPTLKETPGVSKPMPNPMLPMGGGSFAVSPERLAAKTWLDDLKVPGSETLKGIKGGSYSVASGAVNNSYQMGKMSLGAVPGTAMPMIPNLETRNKIEQGYKNAPSSPLAKELYEKSKQYAQTEGTGWKGFVGQAVGNAIPYMAASVAGGVVNPAAPFMVGFAVEGNEAYFEAIDSGASEEEARLNQVIVGTANAAIEQLQVGGIFKFAKNGKQVTKELVDAVKDKAFKKLAKTGGRLSLDTIKNATTEGLEEALQETTSVLAANRVGADISGEEAAKRIGSSALGGSVVGGIMGVGGRIINNTGTKNTDVARNKPTTPIKDQVFGKGLGIGE